MRNVRWCVISMLLVLAIRAPRAPGEIVSGSFERAESLDLTAAGRKDWAVFGLGLGKDSLAATDFMKGGSGITKKIRVSGLSKKAFGGDGHEGTMWTGVSWGWRNGTPGPWS